MTLRSIFRKPVVVPSKDSDEEEHPSGWYVFRRLSAFVLPHWVALVFTFGLVGLGTVMDLAGPWPMKIIIDSVLTSHSLTGTTLYVLIGAAGSLVAISFVGGLLSYFETAVLSLVTRTIVFEMRAALFDHIQRMSLQFHSNRRTGDLMTRVTGDVKTLQDILTSSLIDIVISVLYLVGMGALLLWIDWQLALVAMLAGPPMYILLIRYTSQVRELSREERRREGALASVLHETLGAIRLTLAFNREAHARERFRQESYGTVEAGYAASLAGARFGWAVDVLRAVVTGTVLGLGVWRVMSGVMTTGEMLVFYSYVRSFYSPLRSTMKQIENINRAIPRAERVVELLDTKEGVTDLPGARRAPVLKGDIAFKGLSFSYEQGRPILSDIDVVMPGQKVTALVGPTGAGKTTIASLIPRLYDPAEGAVLIDGVDIREYTLTSLRSQISMVLQETVLFRASVRDNIAYGQPHASFDEIKEAANSANAHDFIAELADGYETVVGERGETLSGGQRQRIAIARAMIRNSPILILDEPLVGLDMESAGAVLQALERLMTGKTVVVITHQLNTVARADYIVVIAGGRIEQKGSVEDLAEADGLYRRLVEAGSENVLAIPS